MMALLRVSEFVPKKSIAEGNAKVIDALRPADLGAF